MFSPSSKNASGAKSFLWTFPECPVRIHVDIQFIERLRKEVLDPAAEREVGGLLIGNQLSPNGDVAVVDFYRLPPSSELTRNFVVCTDALTRAIQSGRAADRRVIGFYRTHLGQPIQFRAEDLECARSKFNDPMNVFLVIRPHDGRASAGFFFWQDGSIVGGLTFPFSSAELRSPSWTSLVGGSPKENRLPSLWAQARDKALGLSTGMRIGLVALVAILVALAGALRIYHGTSDTPHSLGLRVERALLGVVVAWNPATPEIETAKDANLLIWDGSSPPAFVRLTTAQLRAGRTFFTSVSDKVEVRLDIIGAAGQARTESIVSVARAANPGSSEAPAIGTNSVVPPQDASPPRAAKRSQKDSAKQPVAEARGGAPVSPPAAPGAKASGRMAELSTTPEPLVPRNPPNRLDALREPKGQPPASGTQPANTVPLEEGELAPSSFQTAVPIRETRPEVPSELRPLIQGDNVVEVQVHISALGKVTAAKPATVKGPMAASLSPLAVNAALGWQFRPATQNGAAVPSEKILEFLFRPSSR